MVKSRRMRWDGYVAHTGEWRGLYRLLVRKPQGKRPLGRPGCRWDDNMKWSIKKLNVRTWTGLIWCRIGTNGELLCIE
jgi:hypothetical protein